MSDIPTGPMSHNDPIMEHSGCDWTTTVIGMEAAHDAMIDHYKAKHWTPEKETPDAR